MYAIIMRGVPGSGKSTVAKILASAFEALNLSTVIHSTDNLCMVDGEYLFDPNLAPERHARNLCNFAASLDAKIDVVICDNTNFKREFHKPYVSAAKARGYQVVYIEMSHPDAETATARNVHSVPVEVIKQMLLSWESSQEQATETI